MISKIPRMECKTLVFLEQLRESVAFDIIPKTYTCFFIGKSFFLPEPQFS